MLQEGLPVDGVIPAEIAMVNPAPIWMIPLDDLEELVPIGSTTRTAGGESPAQVLLLGQPAGPLRSFVSHRYLTSLVVTGGSLSQQSTTTVVTTVSVSLGVKL